MWPHEYAGAPRDPVAISPQVRKLAAGAALTPVWENALGGITFSAHNFEGSDHEGADRFIKWCATGTGENLASEAERLVWAADHGAQVPVLLDFGKNTSGSWLVTSAIQADSAVSKRWSADPQTAAFALGAGLRQLHDRLPVAGCPFEWSAPDRIAAAQQRIQEGDGPESWSAEHQHLSVGEALRRVSQVPSIDPVVCHGDACAPNTLIDSGGQFAGHVDLGSLGVADRWADLAVASWSTVWNYGNGYEDFVYAGYGIEADPGRIAYYRLLWDIS